MSPPTNRVVPRTLALVAAVVVPAALVLLYTLAPTESSWYPRCMFHRLTGLQCPGCGATRCLHALLHGDLRQAAAYNLFFLGLLPVFVVAGVCQWWEALTGRRIPLRRMPPWAVWALFALALVFWVVRNLPWAPFTYLAPHDLAGV
jgi:hypothetical protein